MICFGEKTLNGSVLFYSDTFKKLCLKHDDPEDEKYTPTEVTSAIIYRTKDNYYDLVEDVKMLFRRTLPTDHIDLVLGYVGYSCYHKVMYQLYRSDRMSWVADFDAGPKNLKVLMASWRENFLGDVYLLNGPFVSKYKAKSCQGPPSLLVAENGHLMVAGSTRFCNMHDRESISVSNPTLSVLPKDLKSLEYFKRMEILLHHFNYIGEMKTDFVPSKGNLNRSQYEAIMITLKDYSTDFLKQPIYWKVDPKRRSRVEALKHNVVEPLLNVKLLKNIPFPNVYKTEIEEYNKRKMERDRAKKEKKKKLSLTIESISNKIKEITEEKEEEFVETYVGYSIVGGQYVLPHYDIPSVVPPSYHKIIRVQREKEEKLYKKLITMPEDHLINKKIKNIENRIININISKKLPPKGLIESLLAQKEHLVETKEIMLSEAKEKYDEIFQQPVMKKRSDFEIAYFFQIHERDFNREYKDNVYNRHLMALEDKPAPDTPPFPFSDGSDEEDVVITRFADSTGRKKKKVKKTKKDSRMIGKARATEKHKASKILSEEASSDLKVSIDVLGLLKGVLHQAMKRTTRNKWEKSNSNPKNYWRGDRNFKYKERSIKNIVKGETITRSRKTDNDLSRCMNEIKNDFEGLTEKEVEISKHYTIRSTLYLLRQLGGPHNINRIGINSFWSIMSAVKRNRKITKKMTIKRMKRIDLRFSKRILPMFFSVTV